ncbi:endonuclease domain-containing protein [Sporosarcina ureae]|uniref:endonuclease domain-containing protein n=1 Tax=Sporosarcina ureae TaxID=1571 RepID=UPI000A17AFCF|nr:DUF559 domain-containing protein [Sporosarcina ureae]ARK20130.1 hypothetical protein SporoP32a_00335 [Sporosarcina ureae]
MKIYDAKVEQNCRICGHIFMHNKQGRFTSHLLSNHNLNLNEYLLIHFYDENDLKCSYELCDKLVQLRRGTPKRYCSRSCGGKGLPLKCYICFKKFEASNRQTKTCGSKCAKTLKSNSIINWHKSMTAEEKRKHFENIISKTAKTRKKNGTPSWNSGKIGIYTEETIEKIRASTLKQLANHSFQKTKIEKVMEAFLISLEVNYEYSFILDKRQFDFFLKDYNLIIECDGDYWHANPKFYPKPANWQLERIEIDLLKDEIVKRNGYQIKRFWEDDILNNFETVKDIINDLLATT